MKRPGFALLTVLWIMAAAAVVALAVEATARGGVSAATNRVDLERALWRASDCLERVRASMDAALSEGTRDHTVTRIWRSLGAHVARDPVARAAECDATMHAAGSRLDVNRASDAQLGALLRGVRAADADGLADRVLDWRDADDDARPRGAESGWYLAQGLAPPRNGPIDDLHELAALDAGVAIAELEGILSVEPGRISLNHAPAQVLEVVPGFMAEMVERILLDREHGREITDVPSVAARISRPAADSVMAHYPTIVGMTTADPDAWIVLARGWSGSPALSVRIDARVVLDGTRASIARRRILP